MQLELISTKRCPFVQRSAIMLNHKGIEHRMTFVDLDRVENVLGDGPYFNGEKFSLIDAAYAPIFIRLDIFGELLDLQITDNLPKVHAWQDRLLALQEVQKARVPELPDLFRQLITSRDAYAQVLLH